MAAEWKRPLKKANLDIAQARQVAALISANQQAALAAAHERYMYFTGVHTDSWCNDAKEFKRKGDGQGA